MIHEEPEPILSCKYLVAIQYLSQLIQHLSVMKDSTLSYCVALCRWRMFQNIMNYKPALQQALTQKKISFQINVIFISARINVIKVYIWKAPSAAPAEHPKVRLFSEQNIKPVAYAYQNIFWEITNMCLSF